MQRSNSSPYDKKGRPKKGRKSNTGLDKQRKDSTTDSTSSDNPISYPSSMNLYDKPSASSTPIPTSQLARVNRRKSNQARELLERDLAEAGPSWREPNPVLLQPEVANKLWTPDQAVQPLKDQGIPRIAPEHKYKAKLARKDEPPKAPAESICATIDNARSDDHKKSPRKALRRVKHVRPEQNLFVSEGEVTYAPVPKNCVKIDRMNDTPCEKYRALKNSSSFKHGNVKSDSKEAVFTVEGEASRFKVPLKVVSLEEFQGHKSGKVTSQAPYPHHDKMERYALKRGRYVRVPEQSGDSSPGSAPHTSQLVLSLTENSTDPPIDAAIQMQYICAKLYTISHGFLGGIAVHLLLVVLFFWGWDDDSAFFVRVYSILSRVMTIFSLFLTICVVSILDKCDPLSWTYKNFMQMLREQTAVIFGLIIYAATIALHNYAAPNDEDMFNQFANVTAHKEEVTMWKYLTIFRCIGCIIAGFVILYHSYNNVLIEKLAALKEAAENLMGTPPPAID